MRVAGFIEQFCRLTKLRNQSLASRADLSW